MEFVEYLALIGQSLKRAQDAGNLEEYLRLLGVLQDALNDAKRVAEARR